MAQRTLVYTFTLLAAVGLFESVVTDMLCNAVDA
jgi:hypothetical protein